MAKKALTAPAKGTRDFLASDIRRRRYVTDLVRQVYESHGFEPLETPAYERLDTLLGKYGDEGDQLVFKILRRGQSLVDGIRRSAEFLTDPDGIVVGRSGETAPGAEPMLADLGLRYDLTVPLARVVADNPGKLPAIYKRYQIQPVWRADNPGKGRFREFYQCDVDVVGSDSALVEVELCAAVCTCLTALGFQDFTLRLNHRALLRAMIEQAGIPVALEGPAIVALDKLDKIGDEGVRKELQTRGVDGEVANALLALSDPGNGLPGLKAQLEGHEAGLRAVSELETIIQLAAATPAAGHLQFDPSLARGLGYYTGAIFEVMVPDLAGSLGGGGRYDDLIGTFSGKSLPACGFSLGLERILVVMEQRSMFPATLGHGGILFGYSDPDVEVSALEAVYQLRAHGMQVELLPKKTKAGKLRKQADERGFDAAFWLEGGQLRGWSREAPLPEPLTLDAIVTAFHS